MDTAQARLLPPSSPAHPPQPPPAFRAKAALRAARVRLVLSSLAILGVFAFAAVQQRSSGAVRRLQMPGVGQGEWVVGRLEERYAVCGQQEGGGVYTARGDGGERGPPCLVVQGNHVVELANLATVQQKYGDRDSLGPPSSPLPPSASTLGEAAAAQVGLAVPKGGLKVYHLPQGAIITPGLVDSHGHLMMYGQWASAVDLTGSTSMADVVARLVAYLEANPDVAQDKERWIDGVGWDQNGWAGKVFPTWEDLEAEPLLQNRKIVLTRIDSHALLCSHSVLTLLAPLPPSIPGGSIVRSPSGAPTGVLMDNAMSLVDKVRDEPGEPEFKAWASRVARDAVSKGLVGVHDAGTSFAELAFYTKQAARNALPLRVYSMIACPDRSQYCGDAVEKVGWEAHDGRFRVEGVKLVADGALGSWGAAMHEPYTDRTDGWRGLLLADEDRFGSLVDEWVRGGWQVNVHAIGDRANTVVLDAFTPHLPPTTTTSSPSSSNPLRLRLEHAQILTPSDVARLVDRGVIASYQPTHATSDMAYVEVKIGEERVEGAYAWRSVLDGGGRIALGSDFPIESIDPLKGFYAAVTRLDEAGQSPHGPGGWYPDQRLTRAQALKGMTIDAAYASFSENLTGTLEPGKRADYVVWDRDIMACPPGEILEAKVLMTVIDGQPVWGSI